MIKRETGRLNAAYFVAPQRDVGRVVSVEAKFRLCVLVDRDESQSGFRPLFTNDICYIDKLITEEHHQRIAKFVRADFSNIGHRHAQPPDTDCDVERRTAGPFFETNTSTKPGSDIRGYKIKKSFAADQNRRNIAHRDLQWGFRR